MRCMRIEREYPSLVFQRFGRIGNSNLYSLVGHGDKSDQQVGGELIAVKENSLLLLESESGIDASVKIGDINVIKIVKRSKAIAGAGIGLLTGSGIGALAPLGLNIGFKVRPSRSQLNLSLKYALILGAVGGTVGTIFGLSRGKNESIQIEGRPDLEIKEALKKLRSKARIPDLK